MRRNEKRQADAVARSDGKDFVPLMTVVSWKGCNKASHKNLVRPALVEVLQQSV